jgi:hypothetical protein
MTIIVDKARISLADGTILLNTEREIFRDCWISEGAILINGRAESPSFFGCNLNKVKVHLPSDWKDQLFESCLFYGDYPEFDQWVKAGIAQRCHYIQASKPE